MASQLTINELFDPEFLSALQNFTLRLSRIQKGGRLAEQKSTARGQGLEFADYKGYVPGDDLRAIDWNIYNRLGKIFVRVFEEQQDLPVYFLVDVSSSMFLESTPRIHAALRTTLALSAIALSQHDSIGLFPFAEEMQIKVKSSSGKRNIMRTAQHLVDLEEQQGGTSLATSITHLANIRLRQGLVVIISDFFDEEGLDKVIAAMKQLRHRILLVQMTQPWDADPEQNPELYGDVRLQDCESDAMAEVTITPAIIHRYKEIYQQFNQQLEDFAKSYSAGFTRIDASGDVLKQLTKLFESGGLQL